MGEWSSFSIFDNYYTTLRISIRNTLDHHTSPGNNKFNHHSNNNMDLEVSDKSKRIEETLQFHLLDDDMKQQLDEVAAQANLQRY